MTILNSSKDPVFGFTLDGHISVPLANTQSGTVSHSEAFENVYLDIPGTDYGQYTSLNIDGQRFQFSTRHSQYQSNHMMDQNGEIYRVEDAYQSIMNITFKSTTGTIVTVNNVTTNGLVFTEVDEFGIEVVPTAPITYYFPLSTYENFTEFVDMQMISATITSNGQYSNNLTLPAMSSTITSLSAASCFSKDTFIKTIKGNQLVQNLKPGDSIITLEHGEQKILWIGQQEVCGLGKNAPIIFDQGNEKPLIVSPQHRIFTTSHLGEILFDHSGFLIKADDLINNDTIFSAPRRSITYYHILLSRHEIICADGIWVESLSLNPDDHEDIIQSMHPKLNANEFIKIVENHKMPSHLWLRAHEVAVLNNFIN